MAKDTKSAGGGGRRIQGGYTGGVTINRGRAGAGPGSAPGKPPLAPKGGSGGSTSNGSSGSKR